MQYHEFIGQVQHRARLPNDEQAVAGTRATLETLAAQLPKEIAFHVRHTKQDHPANASFSLDEFFRRVSAREGVDLPKAIFHAQVVIGVLKEAVSPGEIRDVRAQLPKQYDRLFEEGSTDPSSPGES